jgi:hypothetical protein
MQFAMEEARGGWNARMPESVAALRDRNLLREVRTLCDFLMRARGIGEKLSGGADRAY